MKKKRQKTEQQVRPDGAYWLRLFVPLRGGHYDRECRIVSIEGGMVRFVGSDRSLAQDAQMLRDALWVRIEPPPLVEPPPTALAIYQAGNRQKRRNRQASSNALVDDARAEKVLVLARGIVDAFIQVSDDLRSSYADAAEKKDELVQQVAALIERLS